MKAVTKEKLRLAWKHCDSNEKSTGYMLQYMQDVAGVDLDCVLNLIEKCGSWTNITANPEALPDMESEFDNAENPDRFDYLQSL